MVKCPVEGCTAEVLARGVHLHVRQTSGDGHGPHGEVPDHITFDNLETVGTGTVEMEYPEQRETEQVGRLCPYCFSVFSGKQGVRIHLGQVAGRKNHPLDANERHSPEDFPRVAVDRMDNVVDVLSESVDSSEESSATSSIPVERVYRYIARLLADGEQDLAREARQQLFGPESDAADDTGSDQSGPVGDDRDEESNQ
jgi:hypothetical protein